MHFAEKFMGHTYLMGQKSEISWCARWICIYVQCVHRLEMVHGKIDSIKVKRPFHSVHFVYHIGFIRCNVQHCHFHTQPISFDFMPRGKKRDVKHDEIICTSVQMYNMQSIFYLILSNRIKNRMKHEGITHMNITTGAKFMNGSWEVITNAWKSHCGVHISTYRMNVELSKDPIQMMFLQIMLFTCNCSDYIKGSLELCGCSSTVWSN